MDPAVGVSRIEWDSFLSEFSNLVQKYELVLSNLDLAKTRMEGLQEKTEQQMAKSGETLRQVRTALDKVCEETEAELVESE